MIGLKYYILPENNMYETNFKKTSKGGIQGHRYKDLRGYIELDDYNNVEIIADELRNVTWQ